MDSTEVARLMGDAARDVNCSCSEAAGALVGVLTRLQNQLSPADLSYLIIIGGVLFREGLREFESSGIAGDIIHSAQQSKTRHL
jgi:hypothetical protein